MEKVRKHSRCVRKKRWDYWLYAGLAMEIFGLGNGGEASHYLRDVTHTDTPRGRVTFIGGAALLFLWALPHILDPDDNWFFEELFDEEPLHRA